MKNKIIMFALLCALMVGVVPLHYSEKVYAAVDTTNEDNKYIDVEDFMHSMGYSSFEKKDGCVYFVYSKLYENSERLFVFEIKERDDYYWCVYGDSLNFCFITPKGGYSGGDLYMYYLPPDAAFNNHYDYISEVSTSSKTVIFQGLSSQKYYYCSNVIKVFYSDLDVFVSEYIDNATTDVINKKFDEVFFRANYYGTYAFPLWSSDAGLNVHWSSNEDLSSKIPYSYNDYWHIVRRTSSGNWLLTTIGNSVMQENNDDYRIYQASDGHLHVASIYSGDDVNGYKLNVRQYVYDTDGWKVMSYDTYDFTDNNGDVALPAGFGIDGTRLLAYTNVDIYNGTSIAPLYPKSTEYYEVTPSPPTATPEPTPPTGGGVSGGGVGGGTRPEVTPAVGAGQATVVENRTGVYEEPQDSQQIQHYLYKGQVVYVIDVMNDDWYYIRYEANGTSYTGYVKSSRVEYDTENGFASESVTSGYQEQISDLLGMIGAVPMMIGAVFSFLPPWCLAIVGVAFTSIIGLILWKTARG